MIEAVIPLPIQIVIDDVGWWSGENGSERGEPYRTGIARRHVSADYAAIASLGRQLNMRQQAAMILCEWDNANILRRLPSCQWMGAAWDNHDNCGAWMEEAAAILCENRGAIELTLHGIGHEFWSEDASGTRSFTRAEWHDRDGVMRPKAEVLARLELFQEILAQHKLGDFPTSFVPCAFLHRFGNDGDHQEYLAALLKPRGIDFISTPFSSMKGVERVSHEIFGFDNGVLTVDRGRDLLQWYAIGQEPTGEIEGAICGMHWPNILHEDPERNEEIVGAWVRHLQKYEQRLDRTLAPDTAFFASQLLHAQTVQCVVRANEIILDLAEYFALPAHSFIDGFMLKVRSPQPLRFSSREPVILQAREETDAGGVTYTLDLQNTGKCRVGRLAYQLASSATDASQ